MTIPGPENIQICQQCGSANPTSFKFCQRCGHVLGSAASPPPMPVGALPPRPVRSPTVRPYDPSGQWSPGDLTAGRFLVHRKIVSGMGVVYLYYDQQVCLAGLPSYRYGPSGGSGTFLGPIDDLDLRT